MFFDPSYMLVMGVGLLLSLGAQAWVKSAVSTWSRVATARGMTGAEIALGMLRANGIQAVRVEPVSGFLSDHYDPSTRTLRLSHANYSGRSVAAAGIAAHEAGHALQHRDGYRPMLIRQKLVPVANIGTNLGVFMVMGGMALGAAGLAKLGVVLFAGFVLFTLVTLPVEFDASRRAYNALTSANIVLPNEAAGVRTVLTAAAATYVAAAVTAILQLLYFALRAGLLGGRRQE
jgi:Zn-dependent membrane protease YugP